jgi:hypothetical protein
MQNQKKGLTVSVDPLPPLVTRVLAAAARLPDDSGRYDRLKTVVLGPGETLEDRMMPFQREGVKFGLARGGRVLVRLLRLCCLWRLLGATGLRGDVFANPPKCCRQQTLNNPCRT